MSYRASLSKCIEMMAYQFQQANYDLLHITCSERGKYYTLMTTEELKIAEQDGHFYTARMICSVTPGELKIFTRNNQLTLFKEPANGNDAKTIP